MLYGGKEGYIKQQKTPLFSDLDSLRGKWKDAVEAREYFRSTCLADKSNWPENYENDAGPYNDEVDASYSEYNNLKMQVERYEAAIFRYASGDLKTVLLQEANGKI